MQYFVSIVKTQKRSPGEDKFYGGQKRNQMELLVRDHLVSLEKWIIVFVLDCTCRSMAWKNLYIPREL